MFQVSPETGRVRIDLEPGRVELEHYRCGFTATLSMDEFRSRDRIECVNCNLTLVSYSDLVLGLKQGLMETSAIKRRHARAQTRRHILKDLQHLEG
jgi:hypothetical protein